MSKIKMGVIGVGNMGKNHVRLIGEMRDDFILAGVYDPNREAILKTGYEGKIYDSDDELISDVEAVVIAAPSSFHKAFANKAIKHNVHCLVEKPLALSYKDAEDILDASKEKSQLLMVGHVERFNPVVIELEKILKNEKIIAVTIERCSPMDKRISDTDVIYDLMIHDVDILLHSIMPSHKIKHLYASGRTSYNEKNVDYVQAMFDFDTGVRASIIASRTTEQKIRSIQVHCMDSFISCDLLTRSIVISRKTHYHLDTGYNPTYRQENILERVFVPNYEPLRKELACFADEIRNGAVTKNTAQEACEDLRILDQIKEQVYAL